MTFLKMKISLLVGLILAQTSVKASVNSSYDVQLVEAEQEESSIPDLFQLSCERLEYLELKNELTILEINEFRLLDEMTGKACSDPEKYRMASSASHKKVL